MVEMEEMEVEVEEEVEVGLEVRCEVVAAFANLKIGLMTLVAFPYGFRPHCITETLL